MEKILVIIPQTNLLQLYHELLRKRQAEVLTTSTISHAIVYMLVEDFSAIILVDKQIHETLLFLQIRQKRRKWFQIKLILVSKSRDLYKKYLHPRDKFIAAKTLKNPETVVKLLESL